MPSAGPAIPTPMIKARFESRVIVVVGLMVRSIVQVDTRARTPPAPPSRNFAKRTHAQRALTSHPFVAEARCPNDTVRPRGTGMREGGKFLGGWTLTDMDSALPSHVATAFSQCPPPKTKSSALPGFLLIPLIV